MISTNMGTQTDPIVDMAARFMMAKKSLRAFRRFFMRTRGDVKDAPYHKLWDETLLRGTRHAAFMCYRESGKTEYADRMNLLHALTFPTERREYILLVNSTRTTAENKLKAAMREFTESEMMTINVADIVEQSGRAAEVWYKNEDADRRVRIETYGRGSAIRGANWSGRRPDLIICDDLQDFEDSESETQMEKDWQWFLADIMALGQNSRIFMIGNNLGERCIMKRVINNRQHLNFDAFVIPKARERVKPGEETGELYDPTWPAKYTIEEIRQERESFRELEQEDIFYQNMMCKTISPESQMFKRKHFKYYDLREVDTRAMNVYIIFDPASTESNREEVDKSAIIVVGVDQYAHWFILDLWAGRVKPSESFDILFRLVSKWQPNAVGYEKVQYQAAVADFLEGEMPRRGIRFNVVPLVAARQKNLRISTALQPRYVQGMIWHPTRESWVSEFEEQLLSFPHGAHDDMIDALAYVEQIAITPYKKGRSATSTGIKRSVNFNEDVWGDV